ncbi:hypothetical protein [Oleomonas cavernae]|uniref:hypothetical protein n=1 Tax=Oleomonas cavernae TaxID=2320859 RepID=UPI001F4188A8|nr:hypothetical protein [Oleomonas cavernae]
MPGGKPSRPSEGRSAADIVEAIRRARSAAQAEQHGLSMAYLIREFGGDALASWRATVLEVGHVVVLFALLPNSRIAHASMLQYRPVITTAKTGTTGGSTRHSFVKPIVAIAVRGPLKESINRVARQELIIYHHPLTGSWPEHARTRERRCAALVADWQSRRQAPGHADRRQLK